MCVAVHQPLYRLLATSGLWHPVIFSVTLLGRVVSVHGRQTPTPHGHLVFSVNYTFLLVIFYKYFIYIWGFLPSFFTFFLCYYSLFAETKAIIQILKVPGELEPSKLQL